MKSFETEILKELLSTYEMNSISLNECDLIEDIEYSGVGYFLTIESNELPKERVVLSRPDIRGKLSGIDVGYLAFIQNSTLTLECYTYGDEITSKHRDGVFRRD